MRRMPVYACVMMLAVMLFCAMSGRAAQPLQPRLDTEGSATPMRGDPAPAAAAPSLQNNIFEIAIYLRNNQKSEEDTEEFEKKLQVNQGWKSKVDPTEDTYLALRKKCTDKAEYCDVISLVETVTGKLMTIKMYVYSTPDDHRNIHANYLDSHAKPKECGEEIMDEASCREALMHEFVNILIGLDRLHVNPAGNK